MRHTHHLQPDRITCRLPALCPGREPHDVVPVTTDKATDTAKSTPSSGGICDRDSTLCDGGDVALIGV